MLTRLTFELESKNVMFEFKVGAFSRFVSRCTLIHGRDININQCNVVLNLHCVVLFCVRDREQ